MLDKFSLTDKECENLAKGIAIGAGLGTLIGIIIDNVTFAFSFGGVAGIIGSLIYSTYVRCKKKTINKLKID